MSMLQANIECQTKNTKEWAGGYDPNARFFLSYLKKWGYIYYYHPNNLPSKLVSLLFVYLTSMEIWKVFLQVMLMDVTYKTNKYKMHLLEIVSVTSTQLTFCFAFILSIKKKNSITCGIKLFKIHNWWIFLPPIYHHI